MTNGALWCAFYIMEILFMFGPHLKDDRRADVRLEGRTFWEWEQVFCDKKVGSPISRNGSGNLGTVQHPDFTACLPRNDRSGGRSGHLCAGSGLPGAQDVGDSPANPLHSALMEEGG